MKILPVILCGGSGTRLWPLSRQIRPKQFLPLLDDETIFTKTCKRVFNQELFYNPIVVSNENFRFNIREELKQMKQNAEAILLEPIARNTAGAIAVAASYAKENIGEDVVLLVMPSDHIIKDTKLFVENIKRAELLVQQGNMVTFGIEPKSPETAYGYIEKANEQGDVAKFIEKPDKKKAIKLIGQGNCYWNSGIFAFTAEKYLTELKKYEPATYENALLALANSTKLDEFTCLEEESFKKCKDTSIDYAVMEKTSEIKIITLPKKIGWNDLGSFNALHSESEKCEKGNSIVGDVISENNENCYLRSDKGLLVGIGLKNIIVIQVNDVTLVLDKENAQSVKDVVKLIRNQNRTEHLAHPEVLRPWGSYEEVFYGDEFKVKYIVVNPHSSISLQYHNYRAEHWIVVKGKAKVTIDEKTSEVISNQSTFIPVGAVHRIENIYDEPLEFIEVQTGSILEESDITRLEDKYNRVNDKVA